MNWLANVLWHGPPGLPRWVGWFYVAVTAAMLVLLVLTWRAAEEFPLTSFLIPSMFACGSGAILLWDRARPVARVLRLAWLSLAIVVVVVSVRGLATGG